MAFMNSFPDFLLSKCYVLLLQIHTLNFGTKIKIFLTLKLNILNFFRSNECCGYDYWWIVLATVLSTLVCIAIAFLIGHCIKRRESDKKPSSTPITDASPTNTPIMVYIVESKIRIHTLTFKFCLI